MDIKSILNKMFSTKLYLMLLAPFLQFLLSSVESLRKKLSNLQENTLHCNNGFILMSTRLFQEKKGLTKLSLDLDTTIKLPFMVKTYKLNLQK